MAMMQQVFSQNYNFVELGIGSFKSYGQYRDARALFEPDTAIVDFYYIPVDSYMMKEVSRSDGSYFIIPCTPTTYETLTKIRDKYKEWSDLAMSHNTESFDKDIDIVLPVYKYAFRNNKNQYITKEFYFKNEESKFIFRHQNRNSRPSLWLMNAVKDQLWNGKTYHKGFVLRFASTEEFAEFVEFMKPENVVKRAKSESIDALFK